MAFQVFSLSESRAREAAKVQVTETDLGALKPFVAASRNAGARMPAKPAGPRASRHCAEGRRMVQQEGIHLPATIAA